MALSQHTWACPIDTVPFAARMLAASFWEVNCVPRSAWSTTPAGEADAGGSGHVERGDDQVGALPLTHGLSEHSARVRIAHGAQVDPALRAPQVGKVRDPHAVSRALVPLAGAVVLMGHWTPPTALAVMRARM